MNLIFGVIFLISYQFGGVTSTPQKNYLQISQDDNCVCPEDLNSSTGIKNTSCKCPSIFIQNGTPVSLISKYDDKIDHRHALIRRDTMQDLMSKFKGKNSKLFPNSKSKSKLFEKKFFPGIQHTSKFNGFTPRANKPPAMFKEFQQRMEALKKQMSIKPQFKLRSALSNEEKPNLIEQLKTKQEALFEKIKHATLKPIENPVSFKKFADSQNLIQNRFDIGNSKLGSIHKKHVDGKSTGNAKKDDPEKSKNKNNQDNDVSSTTEVPNNISQGPIVVLLSSTTTEPQSNNNKSENKEHSTEVPNNIKSETPSSAIQRFKEKQKEVVTKLIDQISLAKKAKDKEIADKNEES